MASKAALVIIAVGLIAGCTTARDYDRALYGCVRCTLPEPITPGKALAYVVRRPVRINQYEEVHIFVEVDGTVTFVGAAIDNEYCPIQLSPGLTTVMVRSKAGGESRLLLDVAAGSVYYVSLDIKVGLVTPPSASLSRIDAREGELLLSAVQGKCFDKTHEERRKDSRRTRG